MQKIKETVDQLTMGTPPEIKRSALFGYALMLCLAGGTVYYNSFRGDFLLDDSYAIVEHETIGDLFPLSEYLTHPIHVRRPLVALSLTFNHALGGLEKWGYHAFNLTTHLLAALALFGVLRRSLMRAPLQARFGRHATELALVTTLLWTVHPLQTQAVTYIIQRAETMMAACMLLTLYCFIRSLDAGRKGVGLLASVLFCALGMGCKQVMVAAPPLVLLYDALFVSTSIAAAVRRLPLYYVALFATCGIIVLLGALSPPSASAGFGLTDITPVQYAQSQFGVILYYLKLVFIPVGLCFDYGPFHVNYNYGWPYANTAVEIFLPAIPILALLGATLFAYWRRHPLAYCGLWFFFVLAPTSTILPLFDLAFEHRMYLPLAAVLTGIVLTLYAMSGHFPQLLRKSAAIAVCLTTLMLGFLTIQRNEVYRSARVMYEDVIRKRPNNTRAHNMLGNEYVHAGRYQDAFRHFDESLRLYPDNVGPRSNRAGLFAKLQQYDQAIVEFHMALETARKTNPNGPEHGRLHTDLGASYLAIGRNEEAVRHFQLALKANFGNARLFNNYSAALINLGQYTEAVTVLAKAVPHFGDDFGVRFNLAMALLRLDRLDEAEPQLQAAEAIKPGQRDTVPLREYLVERRKELQK